MFRALLLIGFVWFIAIMGFLAWWAGRKDERIDTTDCFSRYRLHVHDCEICRPPDVRCAVGVALRHEAVETFVDKQQERPTDDIQGDPYCNRCDEFADGDARMCPSCGVPLMWTYQEIQEARADEAYDRLKGK